MNKIDAKELLRELKDKNMSFGFTVQGRFITRGDCRKALNIELDKNDSE